MRPLLPGAYFVLNLLLNKVPLFSVLIFHVYKMHLFRVHPWKLEQSHYPSFAEHYLLYPPNPSLTKFHPFFLNLWAHTHIHTHTHTCTHKRIHTHTHICVHTYMQHTCSFGSMSDLKKKKLRHNTKASSSPWWGNRFFSQSTISADSLMVSIQSPCVNNMRQHLYEH